MGHIDSIRGIAALLVAYVHSSDVYTYIPVPAQKAQHIFLYDIAHELGFGVVGVIAFFAISGFVICPTLKGGQFEGTRKFMIGRFFRLFPAFWVSMILALLVMFVWRGRSIDVSQVLGNIPMLYSVFQVKPLMGLYWTLEVELIFYLLCLFLFLCGGLHKPLILFFVGLVLALVNHWISVRPEIQSVISNALSFHWKSMAQNLAIMFWGGLFRIWYDNRQQKCALGSFQIPLVAFIVVLLFAILWRLLVQTSTQVVQGNFEALDRTVPYFLGLGLFIVGALYIKMNNRFLVWLGTISYSLYLLHPIAADLVGGLLLTQFTEWRNLHISAFLLLCLLLSILLAGLVYHSIEKPAIKLGRFLQNR